MTPALPAHDPALTLGTAVIGVGYFGSLHACCYSRLPGNRLLALVDPDPATQALAERLSVPWYKQLESLPSSVQAVSVATPVASHYEVTRTLLLRGIDVLLEKPITETPAQAAELRYLAEASQCVLQVGHIERFNPAFACGPALLSQARSVRSIRTTRRSPRASARDVVIDLMIHDLDLIRCGIRADVVELQASGRSHGLSPIDEAEVDLTFANGCRVCLHAHWGSATGAEDRCMVVEVGEHETWAIDFRQRISYRMTKDRASEPDFMPAASVPGHDALSLELESFLDASRRRAVPRVTPEDGHAALGLAQQIRLQILGGLFNERAST
ncbi:MAG TPA: Gfo/Idh/MocA family oxidoreductase [Noviherbaspirillum sp.]|uniref:Gfo/Idh/MocA family protein n=1 Tax=Noviherbaspirillum sp. TaxID=1926288 RepID=UPI002D4A1F0D|nr:Gfo/Idh/MocA family oxidoreductase [Noviherbaspirillum sp.]HYD95288.1 Gfo/Idh/MocA family oxidoreductase [Noviherbaspirillum sp.]